MSPRLPTELYDADARDDLLFAEYERARDLLYGKDWRRGLQELESLANRGSVMSILLIADALRRGWKYARDLPNAEAWYQVAVERGSVRGRYGLGLTHIAMGRFDKAIEGLNAAIIRNYPPAYSVLAGIYFEGKGVPVDRKKALNLWRRGASLGHLPSKRNLAYQRLRGADGLVGRIKGFFTGLQWAIEMVGVQDRNRYTDRLR